MFWSRKKADEPTIRALGEDVRHFVVQGHGQNFRHDRVGLVGFYTTRAVTAPHEDNALAQVRALIPVQLMPFGTPADDFSLDLEIVREGTLKSVRRLPLNGFVFYTGPDDEP